jgi:hypothetical protein
MQNLFFNQKSEIKTSQFTDPHTGKGERVDHPIRGKGKRTSKLRKKFCRAENIIIFCIFRKSVGEGSRFYFLPHPISDMALAILVGEKKYIIKEVKLSSFIFTLSKETY